MGSKTAGTANPDQGIGSGPGGMGPGPQDVPPFDLPPTPPITGGGQTFFPPGGNSANPSTFVQDTFRRYGQPADQATIENISGRISSGDFSMPQFADWARNQYGNQNSNPFGLPSYAPDYFPGGGKPDVNPQPGQIAVDQGGPWGRFGPPQLDYPPPRAPMEDDPRTAPWNRNNPMGGGPNVQYPMDRGQNVFYPGEGSGIMPRDPQIEDALRLARSQGQPPRFPMEQGQGQGQMTNPDQLMGILHALRII